MKIKSFILLGLAFVSVNIFACSSKSNTENNSQTKIIVPNSQRINYYKEQFISAGYDLNEPLGELWVSGDFCEDIIKINTISNKYEELKSYKLILPKSNQEFTCNILLENYLNTMRIFYVGNNILTPEELYLVENYHETLLFLFQWFNMSF